VIRDPFLTEEWRNRPRRFNFSIIHLILDSFLVFKVIFVRMGKQSEKRKPKSKFESFFSLRKKTPKTGRIIKSRKDKERERRIKHRELIKESEE